jgi:hypothetical protein
MKVRKRASQTNNISVWAEANKKGGFIIYMGIKGTDAKSIVGAAAYKETLEYNLRKAKFKHGIKL